MDKSRSQHLHQKDVESLLVEVDKAYEFVNGIPVEQHLSKQWQILKKPDGDLLGSVARSMEEEHSSQPCLSTNSKA